MLTSFVLYRKNKPLVVGCWEELEYFVEELKRLNPKWIDRRDFKIMCGNELFKKWERK